MARLVLKASSLGQTSPFNEISYEVAKIRKAQIPCTAKDKIMGSNAEKLNLI